MKTVTKDVNKGFVRGVVYPIIALGVHALLLLVMKSGWFTDAGVLAITGFVGYVDHYILPGSKK